MSAINHLGKYIEKSMPTLKGVAQEANASMLKASITVLEQNIGERVINASFDKAVKHMWFLPPSWKEAMTGGWVRSTCLSVMSFLIGAATIFTKHKLPPKYQLFCVLARDAAFLTSAKHGSDAVGLTKFLDKLIPSDLHKQLDDVMTQLEQAGMLEKALNGELPLDDTKKD